MASGAKDDSVIQAIQSGRNIRTRPYSTALLQKSVGLLMALTRYDSPSLPTLIPYPSRSQTRFSLEL